MLRFNVGAFVHKPQGTREKLSLDSSMDFSGRLELNLQENPTAKIELLKLPHEINVKLVDLHAVTECVCSRCLKKFKFVIDIPFAEREFVIDLKPTDLEVGEDVYHVIDSKEIELDGMVREELLLHFPLIAVCSESCKGLCDKCGIDKNEHTCSCVHELVGKSSPFKFI